MPRRRPPRPGALADLSPLRIAKQILILQTAFYACAIVLITFTALVAGKPMNLDRILSWETLRGDTTEGWMFGLDWMLTSMISVVFLLLFIARSKLVPDFALTIHLLHLIATSFYSRSVPRYIFWWLLQACSAALMTFLGMWSCRWRELQPIAFGGHANGAIVEEGRAGVDYEEDDGYGFDRGSGRGKGRDGAGNYEMVPVKDTGSQVT